MGLYILGGKYLGTQLVVPNLDCVRPTSVMLRRKIFDAHQDLDGHFFIDACAGSGAMGLEAFSRGANKVVLIEGSKAVYKSLSQNIKNFVTKNKLRSDDVKGIAMPISKYLPMFEKFYLALSEEQKERVIFFFDPPYEDLTIYKSILSCLRELKFKGIVWLESDRQKGKPQDFWKSEGIDEIKTFISGTSYIIKSRIKGE